MASLKRMKWRLFLLANMHQAGVGKILGKLVVEYAPTPMRALARNSKLLKFVAVFVNGIGCFGLTMVFWRRCCRCCIGAWCYLCCCHSVVVSMLLLFAFCL